MLYGACYMNIIILGPQGSGKGTQARLLADKFNLVIIGVGKALREVAKMDTPLGKQIYEIQNVKGALVPNEIFDKVLKVKFTSVPREQGLIIDGAPRVMDQVDYIEKTLKEFGRKIDEVIYINISEKETINRISKRWICSKCGTILIMRKDIQSETENCLKCGGKIIQRPDDTPENIKKRLDIFKSETLPVIEYFREKGKLLEIKGEQPVEKVFEDILKGIKIDD